MCWYIDIEITPTSRPKSFDPTYFSEPISQFQFHGNYPKYTIDDGHCLCSVVGDQNRLDQLYSVIADVSNHDGVKNIKLRKYDTDHPDALETQTVDIIDLKAMFTPDLPENVWFKITNVGKFQSQ